MRCNPISANTNLTSKQLKNLFWKISKVIDLKLQTLSLFGNKNMPSASTNHLSQALIRIKNVDLSDPLLTSQQFKAIFSLIATCEELKLRNLSIGFQCSNLAVYNYTKARCRLKTLRISY